MKKKRIKWIDYAKGITIILVVLHHSMFADLYSDPIGKFNSLLEQFRMPFFFFIAGLFIHKALFSDIKTFLKSKVAHFLYLYILWSTIRYITDTIPRYFLLNDDEVDIKSILNIFIEPPATLWFIYALLILFIIARITRSFPIITLSISLLLFALSIENGQYEFIDKLARFLPIFLLGYLTSRKTIALAEKIKSYHLIIPIVFLFVAHYLGTLNYTNIALIPFLLSLLGILSGIILAKNSTKISFLSFLDYIGSKSLTIYVLHFLPLNIMKVVLPKVIPTLPELGVLIMVLSGVIIPLLVENLARRIGLYWLFELPRFNNFSRSIQNKSA